jgi:hypothetical protein
MMNNIQIEDMKQIKRIIISKRCNVETNISYFELLYKLHETITNLDASPAIYGQPQSFNIHYLPEFKSLTHLEIDYFFPEDIDFITILRFCPKLQS